MSWGSVLFNLLYFCWWIGFLIFSFINNDERETTKRLGIWICLNLSTLLIPVTRNSLLINLFKLNHLSLKNTHQFMGILCFISLLIKIVYISIIKNVDYLFIIFIEETKGSPIMGTMSTIFLCLCSMLPLVKKRYYELFYYSHRCLSVLGIVTACFHYKVVIYYLIPSLSLYTLDLLLRIFHTHKPIYTKINSYGNEYITISIILKNNIIVKPGSYFFICFYNDISQFQWHPLSLVSYSKNTLFFCVKKMEKNTWTYKLNELVFKQNENLLIEKEIYIQGPYGYFGNNVYKQAKNKHLVFIASGIGITAIFSILLDINYNYVKYKFIKKINVFWIIRKETIIAPFIDILLRLSKNSLFDVQILITSCQDEHCNKLILNKKISKFITRLAERPSILTILTSIYNKHIHNNLVVFSCGSNNFVNDVQQSCSNLNIEFHYESFG